MSWSAGSSPLHAAWHLLALTGMRRGELLAQRWRDFDLAAAAVTIARSAGVVRNKGECGQIHEAAPKTDRSRRVIDIDQDTVAVLRAWKRERGELSLALGRPGALVFSDLEGGHLHPERFWRTWKATVAQCRAALGEGPAGDHDP